VKVQPKSRHPGLRRCVPGTDGPRLGINVSTPAEGGRANRAACTALAQALGAPPTAVCVVAGAASREKVLVVVSDPALLEQRLGQL
jgi:uncharacterized protein